MKKLAGSVSVLAVVAVGCAATVISDEKIQSSTAGVLGLDPGQVAIQNRRSDMTNTYYLAKTPDGAEYACVIDGSALTLGLVNPPKCTKK